MSVIEIHNTLFYVDGVEMSPMVVMDLIERLQRIDNKNAWVIVSGKGPCVNVFEELGANEPFVVVEGPDVSNSNS